MDSTEVAKRLEDIQIELDLIIQTCKACSSLVDLSKKRVIKLNEEIVILKAMK